MVDFREQEQKKKYLTHREREQNKNLKKYACSFIPALTLKHSYYENRSADWILEVRILKIAISIYLKDCEFFNFER